VKLVSLFDDFLKETVNLNQTRIDLLDGSIAALKTFVRGSDWKPHIRGFEEQGSWAHRTIVRPIDGDEFDADLLVMIDPVEGWTAADYVEELGRIFSASSTYADKTKIWDYCVTITYAGDRRIDLAPCVVRRTWEGSIEVCNRTGGFERTYWAGLRKHKTIRSSVSSTCFAHWLSRKECPPMIRSCFVQSSFDANGTMHSDATFGEADATSRGYVTF
jgi:hypothetical protein